MVTKLDLGCGMNKREGFTGVDQIAFEGVDIVADLAQHWAFAEDDSVDEVYCAHFIEHLSARDRIHFANELYRVLKPAAQATIIVPHWASNRAYGDLTHQWPPVAEMWFYYLSRDWRLVQGNAPHTDVQYNSTGYSCNFEATWGYAMHPEISARAVDFQQFAVGFYKEAITDMQVTLTKR